MSYTVKIDDITYDVVSECGEYDYSWHIGGVLRSPVGLLYWMDDAGCSCRSFGDDRDFESLTPIQHWTDALPLAVKAGFTAEHISDFASHLSREMSKE